MEQLQLFGDPSLQSLLQGHSLATPIGQTQKQDPCVGSNLSQQSRQSYLDELGHHQPPNLPVLGSSRFQNYNKQNR